MTEIDFYTEDKVLIESKFYSHLKRHKINYLTYKIFLYSLVVIE